MYDTATGFDKISLKILIHMRFSFIVKFPIMYYILWIKQYTLLEQF